MPIYENELSDYAFNERGTQTKFFSIIYISESQKIGRLTLVEILVEGESVCRMPFVCSFLVYCCSESSPFPQSRSEQYW